MAVTPVGNPYVESSDLVANYPGASEALAERIDIVGVNPFADSAARATAIPSPVEGQMASLNDDDQVYRYSGSAWVSVGLSPGLNPVTPSSIANTGGSASTTGNTTTFTGVSSISLNGLFTATHRNYRMIISVTAVGAGAPTIPMRLRVGGVDNSASQYSYGVLQIDAVGTAPANVGASSQTQIAAFQVDSNLFSQTFDFINPQLSTPTFINFAGMNSTGGLYSRSGTAKHNVSSGFDGVSFNASSSNITGTIQVFGYAN